MGRNKDTKLPTIKYATTVDPKSGFYAVEDLVTGEILDVPACVDRLNLLVAK